MSNEVTEFKSLPEVKQADGLMAVEAQKGVAEVQAMVVSAKRFPRDQFSAYNRIIEACSRKKLANEALYSYPRGGKSVTGPSIRLAEVLAQNWGNMKSGIRELERKDGESVFEAFCWDMETNYSSTKEFTVPHYRSTKQGRYKLTDDRDIYEIGANMGARRLRSCILATLPIDLVDDAVKKCKQTMEGASDEPIKDRIKKLTKAFLDVGVPIEALEKKLGHKIENTVSDEILDLQIIYKTIKDNFAKRTDYFDIKGDTSESTKKLTEKIKGTKDANKNS